MTFEFRGRVDKDGNLTIPLGKAYANQWVHVRVEVLEVDPVDSGVKPDDRGQISDESKGNV